MTNSFESPFLNTLRRGSFLIAAVAVVVAMAGFFVDRKQFFSSYLLGYTYWLNFSLGSLGILMLHHLVSGRWGFLIQRLLEAGTRTIPLMLALFVPILIGLIDIYPWTHHDGHELDALRFSKEAYLNIPFFLVRAALYFGFWIGFMWLLNMWSRRQDETGDPSLTRSMRMLSAPGLIVYVLTVTFASVDWVMSLDPEWFSSIYGAHFVVSQVLGMLALSVVIINMLSRSRPIADIISPKLYHHLGNLLLAFTVLWAYISFSQLLIIWSANLPEEIPYYIRRLGEGWQALSILLLVSHFFVPFILLLTRRVKRAAHHLSRVAIWILVMRVVDLFWLIVPSMYGDQFHIHWLDVVLPVAIGGIWLGVFAGQVQRRPALPLHDPRFKVILPEHV